MNETHGKTQIGNVVISDKMHTTEKRIGRAGVLNVCGVWELTARCIHPDGGYCFRSFGLFATLDEIPQWYYDQR
jgi:hypothetical protein